MGNDSPVQSKSDETKQQLLKAATAAFAFEGFHATSLKKIAQAAGVNQALIAYHFGSKKGLYLAVFDSIVAQIEARVGPMEEQLQNIFGAGKPPVADPESLRHLLFSIVDAMLDLLSSAESREWALLITREQTSPTEAFEVLYSGFMGKMLGLVAQVIRLLKPGTAERDARLFVILIMGQILVFRVSKTAVLRHMGWDGYSESERESVKEALHRSISAWLAA